MGREPAVQHRCVLGRSEGLLARKQYRLKPVNPDAAHQVLHGAIRAELSSRRHGPPDRAKRGQEHSV